MNRPRLLRRVLGAAILALGVSAAAALPAAAQVRWDNDVRLSYEIDDNVREEVSDELRARVARISVRSDLVLDDSTTNQLSLVYQGGFKRYFDVSGVESPELANQFLHEGEVSYRRLVGRGVVQLTGGVKVRDWADDTFFLVNEDGYTRLWGGLSASHPLAPDWAGELGVRASGIEFDHVDEVFGYEAQSARVGLVRRLGATAQADVGLSVEQRTYDGRGKLRNAEDDPSDIFAPDRPRQIDLAHDAAIGVSFLAPFGFQARYRWHRNDSNSFGFDYTSHIWNVQLAQRLPWRMIAQVYGAVELREFDEPVRGLVGALDVEDTDNNVLILRLLKELNGHVDVEARYGRYRNESINLDAFYTKNVYSLGFRFRT